MIMPAVTFLIVGKMHIPLNQKKTNYSNIKTTKKNLGKNEKRLVNNPRYERANIVLNSKTVIVNDATNRKQTFEEAFTDVFFEALAEVIVENGLGSR